MSMTVHVTTHCTDLQVLKEALDEMGIRSHQGRQTSRARRAELTADIEGRKVAFVRNKDGCLEMIGDQDWSAMRDTGLHREIQQQYALVSVRHKAESLGYHIASVTRKADGSLSLVARAWS